MLVVLVMLVALLVQQLVQQLVLVLIQEQSEMTPDSSELMSNSWLGSGLGTGDEPRSVDSLGRMHLLRPSVLQLPGLTAAGLGLVRARYVGGPS